MRSLRQFAKPAWPALTALLIAVGCVPTLRASQAQDAAQNPPGRVGRAALIEGTVTYRTADQNYWETARLNYPVTTGQAFWTEPNAHAALDVGSNSIYLDSSTELDVSALDDQTAQFSLPQGAVFVTLRSRAQSSPYEVQIARGTVTLTDAGRYEVLAGDTQHNSLVTVIDGGARFSGNGVDLEIRSGETAELSGQRTITAQVSPAGPPDPFVAWAAAREQLLRPDVPALASAMTGAADLGHYGQWASVERYGEVWYPNVPVDWAPYHDGYWGWVEPWGWTWLDDESWGFAPFHYGRWLVIDDRWAWMPADETIGDPVIPIYAPALVTFFATQEAIAWVPLGPGEIYVPPYPVSQSYFQQINAAYVSNIRNVQSITTDRTRINQYVNERALTALPSLAMSHSRSVASIAQHVIPARLADARPLLRTSPVQPSAVTVGISPSIARRFGMSQGPSGAPAGVARAQTPAPGPPIHEVHPTPNARLAPPLALGPSSRAQPHPTQAPALGPPSVTHALPGSPVGQAGAAPRAAEPPATAGRASPSNGAPAAAHPTQPATVEPSRTPAAHVPQAPATIGRAPARAPTAAPPRPMPPAAAHAPPAAAPPVAAPPETVGRTPAAPPPPPAAHPQAQRPNR
jgi:hypothetical protein